MAEIILESNFQETLVRSANNLVVIDFWADWCKPCKNVAPIFDKVSEMYKDDESLLFGKCNVEDYPELTVEYTVRNIPTILFIKGGKVVDRLVGTFAENVLIEKIEQYK